MQSVKRNILLTPGPATTTDTVKMAQVVPDICPREREFGSVMEWIRQQLIRIVHGNPAKYTAVLFCGSGTINIDVAISSLLPAGKKILFLNNGFYSSRAVDACQAYGLPYVELDFPIDDLPDLELTEKALQANPDIAIVYTTHNETGTGILNPVREIGALAHRYGAVFVVDTTSTYALLPIDIERDNIDFLMASAQKGLMAMAGLSFIVGNEAIIQKTRDYPKRSYYCNLYMQYQYYKTTGQMHFTPPVQAVYALRKALEEFWQEGESAKYARHRRVWKKIHECSERLGLRDIIRKELQSGLVVPFQYPADPNWDFDKIHDYCYERGFTIYSGIISGANTFRLCSLGAIDEQDIEDFFRVFEDALRVQKICVPVRY